VGGAILPPIMGSIADNVGIQQAFFIPLICFLFVMWYGFHSHKKISALPNNV
jgi:MFS transporter, FHS family, L-fucose permease